MALIEVISDPQIEQTPIEDPLSGPSPDQVEDAPVREEEQTKITGIAAPLIKINHDVIKFDQIVNFDLMSKDFLPFLSFTFIDSDNQLRTLDQPSSDNEIRVQIIPPFDDAYKKIDLTFVIKNLYTQGEQISVIGKYKLPELYSSKLKSFGEITTFDLINEISKETKLGFASNIQSTDDARYIYCHNNNYINIINQEIWRGGNATQILQSWVDYWNYINLVDIYERYNAKDKDLTVWTQNLTQNIGDDTEVEGTEAAAVITNNQNLKNSQLYCEKYNINNNTGKSLNTGTDRVLTIYNDTNKEAVETLIQDGDVKTDVFVKYIYVGEQYGSVPILLNEQCHKAYIQKITNQSIEVNLKSPMLGLMRGHRVDFWWYDMDDKTATVKPDIPNASEETLPKEDKEDKNELGKFSLNKMLSGQYLIYNTSLSYNKFREEPWVYTLTLIRPQDETHTYSAALEDMNNNGGTDPTAAASSGGLPEGAPNAGVPETPINMPEGGMPDIKIPAFDLNISF